MYGNQANIGDEYHEFKKIIFIAIADYVIFPNKPQYKSDDVIKKKKTNTLIVTTLVASN